MEALPQIESIIRHGVTVECSCGRGYLAVFPGVLLPGSSERMATIVWAQSCFANADRHSSPSAPLRTHGQPGFIELQLPAGYALAS